MNHLTVIFFKSINLNVADSSVNKLKVLKKTIPNILLLLVLLISISIFHFFLKTTLGFDKLVYNSLVQEFTTKQIQYFFEFQNNWRFVGYIILWIMLLIKTTLLASILYIGTFFFSKNGITFKKIWKCVIQAEYVFLLVPVVKIAWFCFFKTNYTLEDILYFYPLSALNITGYQDLDPWLIYPLQTLNLFELAYIIYLSYQIGQLTHSSADNGLKIVGCSYVPALLLWVTVVMFFTLNYS